MENEPANHKESERFRRELQDVIDEAIGSSFPKPVAVDDTPPLTHAEVATAWFCIGCVFAVVVVSAIMVAMKGFQA